MTFPWERIFEWADDIEKIQEAQQKAEAKVNSKSGPKGDNERTSPDSQYSHNATSY